MGDTTTQTVNTGGESQSQPVQQLPAGPDYWPVPLSERPRVA